ncbi:NAD-dependent epimerase/dehydratase family protein [Aurantimonas sp. C2-6-R+9]|uniref:NAD-dependent epimerase/dehydratase family protein n=1 Tax=unclassified Aurantimonas TaxID=2638230 RepID=UPI002E17D87B|nr:NAD-dependent epimerase/dehydratase family protein [Aurantimonas sp. C2-6-R+9]
MRIVVTGASGFLGRRLARRLVADGHDAALVSRRVLDAPGAVRLSDYSETPTGDVLVHLAERADRASAEALGDRHEAEALATLEALLAKSWRQVVYASSGIVYGDGSFAARMEDDPTQAAGRYAAAKLACEARVCAAGGTCARLANLYGPGQPTGTVLADILAQVPGSGPLYVRDAAPVRDFLWVDDAVDALVRMLVRHRPGVYNVGSGQGLAIGSLARLANAVAGAPDRPVRETAPSGRASHLVLKVTRAHDQFGWVPQVSPRDGIAKLLGVPSGEHGPRQTVDGQ